MSCMTRLTCQHVIIITPTTNIKVALSLEIVPHPTHAVFTDRICYSIIIIGIFGEDAYVHMCYLLTA